MYSKYCFIQIYMIQPVIKDMMVQINQKAHFIITFDNISGSEASLSWWFHQMETFSTLLTLCAGNSLAPVNFPHKGQWPRALVFSLICTWINNWVNNGDDSDLKHHHAHYDITVMFWKNWINCWYPGSSSYQYINSHAIAYLCKKVLVFHKGWFHLPAS